MFQIAVIGNIHIVHEIKINKMEGNIKTKLVCHLDHLLFNLSFRRDKKLVLWNQIFSEL